MVRRYLAMVKQSLWTELIMLFLVLASIGLLVFELSVELVPSETTVIYIIDGVIATLFLADFLAGWYVSQRRKQYLKKEWYMLLAAIPLWMGAVSALQSVRLLRIVRLLRLLVRMKRIAGLADALVANGSQYIYVSVLTVIVVFTGAVAFFTFEVNDNTEVTTFFDAVWWAVVSATTVGYGDISPVTWEGRVVGMGLMFFGIGLVGMVAGFVGEYVLKKQRAKPRGL